MAVSDRPASLHFLVLCLLLSSAAVSVNGLVEYLGTCGFTIDLMVQQSANAHIQSGILKMPLPKSFDAFQDPNRDIHCDIIITFAHGMNLQLELYYLDIMPTSNVQACGTGLEVFDQTGRNYYGGRICMEGWEWEEKHRETKQEKKVVQNSPVTFRLISEGTYKGYGFKVHFNLFRPYWPCYTREYKCEQIQRCVHDDLTCDGWDDCGDFSDEREEAGCDLLTASEICAIIIGILLLLTTVLATVIFIITYKRLSDEYGVRSESKIPIADNYSVEPVLTFPHRYNSQESMSKMSRVTGPTMNRDSDSEVLDKMELEKADRYSNKDNQSERSYRSNPRRSKAQLLGSEPPPEPIRKAGRYSYDSRKGRSSSQSSLTREKGELVNGIDNSGLANARGSLEKLGSKDRDRDKRSPDDDRRSPSRDRDRRRRRSRERDYRRDDYYSDEDSDLDRDRRRRRRSYDRYSDDDSDYDRDRRRRRRSYDRYSDEDSDSEYERERERRRRRRSRDRYSRERYDDRDGNDKDQNQDPDKPPRRLSSRERDRDRYDEDRGRRRSPDYDDDDDRRDRPRRRSNERRRSPDYDDRDDRRRRSLERRRGPSPEREDRPPSYADAVSSSQESLPKKGEDKASDHSSLPPPPTGEEIKLMEIEHPKSPPKVASKPPVEEIRRREIEPQRSAPRDSNRPVAPPPSGEEIRRREQENLRAPPKVATKPPPPAEEDRRRREMEAKKPPPPNDQPPDEGARRRSTDERRERYSRNRWTPKSKKEDTAQPEYEDIAPRSVFVKAGYREESV